MIYQLFRSLAFMAVISCIVCGGWVSARFQMLDKPPLIQKTQEYIREKVKKEGIVFLQSTYQQLQESHAQTKNPLVRRQLTHVMSRMKQEYALSDTEWTATPIPKHQIFLTKDGKRLVRQGASVGKREKGDVGSDGIKKVKKLGTSHQTQQRKLGDQNDTHSSFSSLSKKTPSGEKDNLKGLGKYSQEHDSAPSIVDDRYVLEHGRINVGLVRNRRLERINDLRKKENGSSALVIHPYLNKTATQWSYTMRSLGKRTHQRKETSRFYDYKEIEDRFKQKGIRFYNKNNVTFTENVGWGRLSCTQGDCTQAVIASLRNTFDYFAGEKGKSYDAHYKTMIEPSFRIVGFGIAVDEKEKVIYSTMHYGTEIQ